jgi:predicted MPP superfamily phosphohydrolase
MIFWREIKMEKSIVLRFRDFVENTILQHTEICKKRGYVWWGWWNKPDENLPKEYFINLLQIIREQKGLKIYLLDSGNYELYECTLLDIKYDNKNQKISCPEIKKSPSYYCHSEFLAWYKIKDINKIDIERIKGYSYLEVEGFSPDQTSINFDHKRVFDIYEMLNRRHRTIYFIEPYDSQKHKSHKIELVYAIDDIKKIDTKENGKLEIIPPSVSEVFMPRPIFRDSINLVHLSDLHFNHEHHNFPQVEKRGDIPLSQLVIKDIMKVCKKSPALLIVSGDLTWHGNKNEFDMAYKFLDDLNSALGLRSEYTIIIPGNHDIQWINQNTNEYIRDKKIEQSPMDAEKNYRDFINSYYGFEPNEYLSMGRRIILKNYCSTDFIALNSCMLEEENFCGYGFVGAPQLDNAIYNMGWESDDFRTDYRFLIMHHHLIAAEPSEKIIKENPAYSITLDSGHISHFALRMGVDFILHGHRHQPFIASYSRPTKYDNFPLSRITNIHGAGSIGVARNYLGEIGKNSYSIITANKDSVEISIRAKSEAETGFDEEWNIKYHHNKNGTLVPIEKNDQ